MFKSNLKAVSLVLFALVTACGVDTEHAVESEALGTVESGLSCGLSCPPGSIPSYYTCSVLCGSCPGAYNAVQCVAAAPPQASISASPSTVSVPAGSVGTTRICWSTAYLTAPVWIRVRVNGAVGKLFTKESDNGSACENAPWIGAGNTYVFSVHTSDSDSAPVLASTTVTGVLSSGGGGTPGGNSCEVPNPSCQSGYDCHCGDICRRVGTICP
ncbi:hypothetical protein [Hyalangium versicolor]|uniref:hypothetical protein n=1 Tax=Hyalangium versicolor TaxID=2861190 RepID=UPI001CCCFFF2|nr:hypothetical protein [Hyalangium versicolor]